MWQSLRTAVLKGSGARHSQDRVVRTSHGSLVSYLVRPMSLANDKALHWLPLVKPGGKAETLGKVERRPSHGPPRPLGIRPHWQGQTQPWDSCHLGVGPSWGTFGGGELLGWSWGESDLPWWEMLCVWGGCLARGGKQTTMGPSCVQQACVLQVRTPKT